MTEYTFGKFPVQPVHADVEQVEITVVIPEQTFIFTYGKEEWDSAVASDEVAYLMDHDLSDLDYEEQVFGPDGHQLALW